MSDHATDNRRRLIRSVEQPGIRPELGLWAFVAVMIAASVVAAATGLADDIRGTRDAVGRCK